MSLEVVPAHAVASLPDRLEYARKLSAAGLLPDSFREQPANVLVGMEIAAALEMAPIVVINELAVIGGKPSFSAKFMRSLVRRAGHRLRESFTDGVARCVIVRSDDPEWEHTATWDEAKARQHNYWGKGHWNKNPELMLKNRALSECVREACPEVLGGVSYTPDEVQDFVPAARQQPRPAAAGGGPDSIVEAVEQHRSQQPLSPVSPSSAAEVADGITDAQSRKLGAVLREHSATTREAQLDLISDVLGRTIKSRNELTKADASHVIDALESVVPEPRIDESTGEVFEAELVGEDGAE